MASIVVCRYCRANLGEPADGCWAARPKCPFCHGQFDASPESIVPLRPAIVVRRIALSPKVAEAGSVVVMPRSLKGALVGMRSSLEGVDASTAGKGAGEDAPRTPVGNLPPKKFMGEAGTWTAQLGAKLQESWHRVRAPGDNDVDSFWQRSIERCRRPQTWGVTLGAVLTVGVWAFALRRSPADERGSPADRWSLTPPADTSLAAQTYESPGLQTEGAPVDSNEDALASRSSLGKSPVLTRVKDDRGTSREGAPSTGDRQSSLEESLHTPITTSSTEKKTHWPVTTLVGALRNPQLVGIEDLRSAYARAEQVRTTFLEGDLTDARRVSQKGQAYKTLCELAHALTMQAPSDMSLDFAAQQSLGTALLRNVAMDENHRQVLSQVATRWWEYPSRSTPGIFFIGAIESIDAVGPWTLYWVHASWEGGGVKIPVLCDKLRFSTGTDVLFIGAVINQPSEELEGYDLSTPQLTLAGYAMQAVDSSIRPRRAFGTTNDLLREEPTN